MSLKDSLLERSGSVCELCESKDDLLVYTIPPFPESADKSILVCQNCHDQINQTKSIDANHWQCLNSSMWSTIPAVQVMAWRLLNTLKAEAWAQDLLDMLYLDEETLTWAKAAAIQRDETTEDIVIHKDSNGTVLQAGDTVVLIKDLDVKGGGFTAKRGTAVRGISLVDNNAAQIEGKVNGQQIVILTQYVKKSS